MMSATRYIEEMLAIYSASLIDDFVVITGIELKFDVKEWNDMALQGRI